MKGRQPSYQMAFSPTGELWEPVQKAQLRDIPLEGPGSWDHYPLTPIHQETRALGSLSTNSCLVYQRLRAAPRETNFPSLSFSPCSWAECGSETTKKVKESQLLAIGSQASGTSKYKGIWARQAAQVYTRYTGAQSNIKKSLLQQTWILYPFPLMMATFYRTCYSQISDSTRTMENSVEIYVSLRGALTHSVYLFGQVVRTSQDIKEKK